MFRAVWSFGRRRNVFTAGFPLLVGVGLTMIYGGDFAYGLTILIIAALWSAAFWLDSDFLKKKKPLRPRPRKNENEQALAQARFKQYMVKYRCWQIGGLLSIAVLCFVLASFVHGKAEERELAKLGGILFPRNDPAPAVLCLREPRPEAIKVFFDNSVSVISKFPHTVVSVNKSPRLSIDKKPDGSISINAVLVSPDGRVIAEIRDDKFIVNPNNYLDMERRNKSNLVVRDQHGKTVLDVTYLNPTAVQVSSLVVYAPTGDTLEMAPNQGSPVMCFDKDSNPPNVGDLDLSRDQRQTQSH